MESGKKIAEFLTKTEAFKDLDQPVILTSGELGIYYINTEKLLQDGGKWKKFGDDSQAMIQHVWKMVGENSDFKEVIDILSGKVEDLLPENYLSKGHFVISGGQRRDWLFSGPVSIFLDLEHIALYKNGKIEVSNSEGTLYDSIDINGASCIHVSDLLTKGSSAVNKWIPMIRKEKATVENYVNVVSRMQGGENNLEAIGVNTLSAVVIDEDFLRQASKYPERAVAYFRDPKWSENYLREHGALALVEHFNPCAKDRRANLFLQKYESVLKETGKMQELENAVKYKYNKSINEILV